MKYLFNIILLFTYLTSTSQVYTLNAAFRDLPFKTIYLETVYGDKSRTIDSVKSDFTGGFHFKFTANPMLGSTG